MGRGRRSVGGPWSVMQAVKRKRRTETTTVSESVRATQRTSGRPGWLPDELVLEILQCVCCIDHEGVRDLGRVACVCQQWHRVVYGTAFLWRDAFQRRWGRRTPFDDDSPMTAQGKEEFVCCWWCDAVKVGLRVDALWCSGDLSVRGVLSPAPTPLTSLHYVNQQIVLGGGEGTVRVHNLVRGECSLVWTAHIGAVWCVQADTTPRIVTGGADGVLRIWNLEGSPHEECVLEGHTRGVRCFNFDGNPCRLVSGGEDRVLRVWNTENGTCTHVLRGHTSAVRCVRVSGLRAVSGSADKTLRLWDLQAGECEHVFRGHGQTIIDVSWKGEDRVVSASWDRTIRVWSVSQHCCVRVLRGHTEKITAMDCWGYHVVSGSADGTCRVWNLETGTCDRILQVHTHTILCLSWDDRSLVVGCQDGTCRVLTREVAALSQAAQVEHPLWG